MLPIMALIDYREEMRHPWLNPAVAAIPWSDAAHASPLSDLGSIFSMVRVMSGVDLNYVRLTERAFEWLTASQQFRRRFEIVTGRKWEGTDREWVEAIGEARAVIALTLGPHYLFEIATEPADWDPSCDVEMSGIGNLVKHIATLRIS
jgi:hypothetical protein